MSVMHQHLMGMEQCKWGATCNGEVNKFVKKKTLLTLTAGRVFMQCSDGWSAVLLFSNVYAMYFGYFNPKIVFLDSENIRIFFQGDPTDISAKKKHWWSAWRFYSILLLLLFLLNSILFYFVPFYSVCVVLLLYLGVVSCHASSCDGNGAV